MTTRTTTDWLSRGIIASMLDPETALVETISVNGRLMSIAFVNGMPMPYETFSMLMLFRMAPNSVSLIYTQQGVPIQHGGGSTLPHVHQQRLHDLIRKHDRLPAGYRLPAIEGFGSAAWDAVKSLYDRVANATDPSVAHENFRAMLTRIDDSYRNSLVDPQVMSAEAFDFNDDRVVADQF